MVTVGGAPTWWPLPATRNQAKHLFNAERWKMVMNAFVEKTKGTDGFMPVSDAALHHCNRSV